MKKNAVLWPLADDVEEVVLASPTESGASSKEKLHIATCMFKCSQESGVPDIQVEFFTLTPLKKMVESCEQQVFHRYAVCKQDNGTAFYPKALTDAEISADTLKKGALGAAWLGELDAPPIHAHEGAMGHRVQEDPSGITAPRETQDVAYVQD